MRHARLLHWVADQGDAVSAGPHRRARARRVGHLNAHLEVGHAQQVGWTPVEQAKRPVGGFALGLGSCGFSSNSNTKPSPPVIMSFLDPTQQRGDTALSSARKGAGGRYRAW